MPKQFTIQSEVQKDIITVWETYHEPKHIMNWNYASKDWHTPFATSDFREGGRFNYRMEAKDGSIGFDFTGIFDVIHKPYLIKYHLDDLREVVITFKKLDKHTYVEVLIDAEEENSIQLQKRGWQAILNNFRAYVENKI